MTLPLASAGDLAAFENRRPHVHGRLHRAVVLQLEPHGLDSAVSLDADRVAARDAGGIGEPGHAADSVAAHLGAAAVGVVHLHPHVGSGRRTEQNQDVAADSEAAIRKPDRHPRGIGRTGPGRDHVHIVVAAPMHLGEIELSHRPTRH
jgi:hypothetical protein